MKSRIKKKSSIGYVAAILALLVLSVSLCGGLFYINNVGAQNKISAQSLYNSSLNGIENNLEIMITEGNSQDTLLLNDTYHLCATAINTKAGNDELLLRELGEFCRVNLIRQPHYSLSERNNINEQLANFYTKIKLIKK